MAFWNNRAGKLNLCPECCTRSGGKQHSISCARGSRKWLVDGDTGVCRVWTIQILLSQEADLRQLWLTDVRKAKQCQTHRGLRKSQFLAKSSKPTVFTSHFWLRANFFSFIMKRFLEAGDAEFSLKYKMISTRVPVWLGEIGGGVVLNWEVSDLHDETIPGKWLPCSQTLRWIHLFTANYYLTKCINQQQTFGQPDSDPSLQKVIMQKLPQGRQYILHAEIYLFIYSFAWSS